MTGTLSIWAERRVSAGETEKTKPKMRKLCGLYGLPGRSSGPKPEAMEVSKQSQWLSGETTLTEANKPIVLIRSMNELLVGVRPRGRKVSKQSQWLSGENISNESIKLTTLVISIGGPVVDSRHRARDASKQSQWLDRENELFESNRKIESIASFSTSRMPVRLGRIRQVRDHRNPMARRICTSTRSWVKTLDATPDQPMICEQIRNEPNVVTGRRDVGLKTKVNRRGGTSLSGTGRYSSEVPRRRGVAAWCAGAYADERSRSCPLVELLSSWPKERNA
jgi:hypothetical protein